MIPREIIKKIRQIEIRTNRLVSGTRAAVSFQPTAKLGRVACSMENRENSECVVLNGKIDAILGKAAEVDLARAASNSAKKLGACLCSFESREEFQRKLTPQSRLLLL